MKKHIAALLGVAVATLCFAGTAILPPECWKAMQDTSRFRTLHSETNIPPNIISDCAAQIPHRRLLWAVTDGKYYVMHHEYVYNSGMSFSTNYSIYIDTTNHASVSCGYTYSFKDYQKFVQSCDGSLGNGD
jgi:hypothetical protein